MSTGCDSLARVSCMSCWARARSLLRGDGWTGLDLTKAYVLGRGPGWRFPKPPFFTLTGSYGQTESDSAYGNGYAARPIHTLLLRPNLGFSLWMLRGLTPAEETLSQALAEVDM